jgi:hypothetical protein
MFGLIGQTALANDDDPVDAGCLTAAARPDLDPVRAHRNSRAAVSRSGSALRRSSIDENIAFFAEIHGVRDFAPRDRLPRHQLTPFGLSATVCPAA